LAGSQSWAEAIFSEKPNVLVAIAAPCRAPYNDAGDRPVLVDDPALHARLLD
jgi:hypothetical protein